METLYDNTLTYQPTIDLSTLQIQLQLPKKDFKLLLEAFRRKHFLESDNKFLGLGLPSSYKSKLFKASFGETPKVSNWYSLTAEGLIKLQELENIFPKFNIADKEHINQMLFEY